MGNRFERHPVATLAALLLAILAAAEGALRLAAPGAIVFVHAARQVHRYSRRWAVDLRPGSRARLRLDGPGGRTILDFVLTVGPDAFRLPGGAPRPNPSGRYVHAVGDSYTMGWGVADDQSYPAILDSLLPDGPRVLNLGVDGFGAVGATERSRELADRFPPAHVVYLFVPNDFEDDARSVRVVSRPVLLHAALEGLDVLRRHTYLANTPFAIRWHLVSARAPARSDARGDGGPGAGAVLDPDPGTLPAPDRSLPTFDRISAFRRFLEARGARFTVLALSGQPQSLACYRFCREEGIETHLIEVPPSLRIPLDDHFTPAGNAWLARFVRDRVLVDARGAKP